MVSQEVLIESLRLASRIDELHQQLAECRRDARAWEVDYQAKEDELNEFADTASAEKTRIQLALDDACVQRDEYRVRVTQLEEVIEKGRFVSANAFSGPMKSVVDSINDAVDKFGAGKDDAAMLSLSRALAHSESVVDILSQGQES